jgi:hypothetical protein
MLDTALQGWRCGCRVVVVVVVADAWRRCVCASE